MDDHVVDRLARAGAGPAHKRKVLKYGGAVLLGGVLPHVSRSLGGPGPGPRIAWAAAAPQRGPDAALFWNSVLLDAALADSRKAPAAQEHGGPTRTSRAAAIVHLALHNAVNAVQPRNALYQDRKTRTPAAPDAAPAGARPEAAGAGAAHAALAALYPGQKVALFDRALAEFRASSLPGADHQPSLEFGAQVAAQLLASRANDGADSTASYQPPEPGPGVWVPDPTLAPPGPPLTPHWGSVRPFALDSGSQLRPPPPPAVTVGDYAFAFARVFTKGGDPATPPPFPPNAPPRRTQDETDIARFWSYDDNRGTPIRLYNQHARQIITQEPSPPAGVSPLHRHARLFALINLAMADAGIACWEAKYHYNLWRPFQGIRQGDADNNPYTTGRADWLPLGRPQATDMRGNLVPNTTPSFPAYVSGHSSFGGVAFAILGMFFGGKVFNFELSSEDLPNVKRMYKNTTDPARTSWQQAINENSESRIFLGVHWHRDHTAGVPLGWQVADRIWPTFLRPTT